ncbi:MAG: hypothetical protein OHK0021_14840 [Bryobacter sp.]
MKNLGIVIVAWNSADQIARCVAAALAVSEGPIVVVDNASSDQTLAAIPSHPRVEIVANQENLGFAGGVNSGCRRLGTEYFLILNPDSELLGGLEDLVAAASEGAAGGQLLDSQGFPQAGFQFRRFPTPTTLVWEVFGINRLWPTNSVNRRYRCADQNPGVEQSVDQPAGAFFCVRRDAFETLGGFDESYWPVWFEDVDFCRRLTLRGYRIRYTPKARARHPGAQSIRKILWSSKELAWYGSLLRYATSQFGWLSRRMVGLAVAAASVPRSVMGILYGHSQANAFSVYLKVIALGLGVFLSGRVYERRMPLRKGSALQ